MIQSKVLFIAFGLLAAENSQSEQLIKTLEIIYLKPERRSPHDRVLIENGQAQIRVWRELPQNPIPEKVECGGYQWLLTGRGEKLGAGAKEVFRKFPNLSNLQLELVENETKSETVDKKGKLKKVMLAKPYLRLDIDRASAAKIPENTKEIRKQIGANTASCVAWGRQIVSKREVNL